MSDLIKNMIAQIADKNYKGAQSAFEDVMTSKIGNAFDLEKVKLAGSIFNDIDMDDLVTESKDDDEDDEDDDEDGDDEDEEKSEKKKKKKSSVKEENLSELSKKTLGSYINKSADDMKDIQGDIRMNGGTTAPGYKALSKKRSNRKHGIRAAVNRLTKEETEIQELSKKTLASYTRKAANDVGNKGVDLGKKRADADEVDRFTNRNGMKDKYKLGDTMKKSVGADHDSQNKTMRKAGQRLKGIDRATARLEK